MWHDDTYTSEDFLAGLPDSKDPKKYTSYKDAYKKAWDFNTWDANMKMRAAAILSAEAGMDEDPTRGATNWSGGSKAQKYNEGKYGVGNVLTIKENGFVHSYFNANTGVLNPKSNPKSSSSLAIPKYVKAPDSTSKNDNLWKALQQVVSKKEP